jgi:uncharacterized protein YkwD
MENNEIAKEIGKLINDLRRDPKAFSANVKKRLDTYEGVNFTDCAGVKYRSQEGKECCNEALVAIESSKPLPELVLSEGLTKCAQAHANDLSETGETGHSGSDGSNMGRRIDKYGQWSGKVGECIAVQSANALDVILQWIIDDGVKSRGDRKTLLSKDFTKIGIGFNPNHKSYKTCAVVVLAGIFGEVGSSDQPVPVTNEKLMDEMPEELKKMPDGAKGMAVTRKTLIEGEKKKTIYTVKYDMDDGSVKEVVKEYDN